MKRHKVLFTVGINTWGGTATGLRGLLRYIDCSRHEPHLAVAPRHSRELGFFRAARVPVHRLDAADPVKGLTDLIRRERISLVQTSGGMIPAARAARAAGIPNLWFVGGPLNETCETQEATGIEGHRFTRTLSHLIDLLSDAIVVPSRFLASTAFREIRPSKLHVIPLGIDPDRLRTAERAPGPHPKRPVIAMVANFYPLKRHSDFLQAARRIHRQLPQARFLIAGRCSTTPPPVLRTSARCRAAVLREIAALGLERHVTMTTFPPDRPGPFFSKIDVLISPSIEAFGQAVGEAMAMGRPVVAVSPGGTGEVIQDGKSGLLVPFGQPRALAAAALKVLRDKALAARLGQGGRRRILQEFTAARQAGRFQRLYDHLLADRP